MLLRDLPLKPREQEHYFDMAWVDLADDTSLYWQFGRVASRRLNIGKWFCYRTRRGRSHAGYVETHEHMDEFEAQAVLDHYIQTVGLKKSEENVG